MNEATCTVLAGVFPLLLIAIVADRRGIHLQLRTRRWYRLGVVMSISACIVGLAFAVVGVQTGGYPLVQGTTIWVLFGVPLLVFALSILMNVATLENEEDAALEAQMLAKQPQLF